MRFVTPKSSPARRTIIREVRRALLGGGGSTMLQVIGTLVTDGTVLSLGLGSGFEKLPLEQQRDVLRFCARFIDATVSDMDQEIDALKDGAKPDADYVPKENAAVEGDDIRSEGEVA